VPLGIERSGPSVDGAVELARRVRRPLELRARRAASGHEAVVVDVEWLGAHDARAPDRALGVADLLEVDVADLGHPHLLLQPGRFPDDRAPDHRVREDGHRPIPPVRRHRPTS
jgi:hypothetical protein